MKKSIFLLLMLAAVSVAVSCEKEPAPFEQPEQTSINPEVEEITAETAKFYGLWTRHVEYTNDMFCTHADWEWRFYDNGRCNLWVGQYDQSRIVGVSSSIIDYEVRDGKLYLCFNGGPDEQQDWDELDYEFQGDDMLVLSCEYEGESIVWQFVRTEDADDQLVGDWSAIVGRGVNDEYIERHYSFTTPTYGYVYEITYNSTGTQSLGHKMIGDFRYVIDGNMIIATGYGNPYSYSDKLYFRVSGTKLYLSHREGENEVMYSNFKAENNIPY